MKFKILLAIILVSIFCIGGTASAMTDSERQALIQQIQSQLNQLIQLLNEMIVSQQQNSSWYYNFDKNLGLINSGTVEVINLHLALQKENISYAPDDINTFSTGTANAVAEFQEKYASEILAPWGLTHGTGFVGTTTRAKLNSLYSSASPPTTCTPNWFCVAWSACANGSQTRTCADTNNCGTTANKPATTQSCTSVCAENWSCGSWTTCSNNQQTRTCTDANNCGTIIDKPETTRICTSATCTSFTYSSWGDCQSNSTQSRTMASSLPAGCTGGSPVISRSCVYVPAINPCTSFTYSVWSACQSNNTQSRTISTSLPAGCSGGSPVLTLSCTFCSPIWTCEDWSACAWGQQTQTCTDTNNCGTTVNKPATTQPCCEPYWQCTWWSTCAFSQQARNCTDYSNCGVTTDMPATTRSCNSDVVSYTIFDSKIAGTTSENAASKKPMFSIRNHETGEFVRNPNCWAKDWNLSPLSVDKNTGSPTLAPSTLISPRHIIMAQHASPGIGAVLKFVDMNNNIITRTITGKAVRVDGFDISIGLLDSDVPAGFSFAKILPADWKTHLNISSTTNRVPLLSFDQELKAIVSELFDNDSEIWINNSRSNVSPRSLLWENPISGDSGFPSFLIVNNELIVLCLYYVGGTTGGGGPNIQHSKTQINVAMASLQGGDNPYQLTEIDLSGFPNY